MESYLSLLDVAKKSAMLSGKYLMRGFRTNPELSCSAGDETRSGMSTEFDKGSNEILTKTLIEGFFERMEENHVFICSEETGFSIAKRTNKSSFNFSPLKSPLSIGEKDYTWVIDPICGSIPFSRGLADFIVAISLMQGNKTILGLVYDPAQDELFFAENGQGAFLNNKKISPSSISSLKEAYLSIEHKVFRLAPPKDLQSISRNIRRLRVAGTCGLELSYIACGRIDGLIKLNQPLYDYSAGAIILKEALNGKEGLSGTDGKTIITPQLCLEKNTSFIATNSLIHSELSETTKHWNFLSNK